VKTDRTKQTFRDPGNEWRGAPFWGWNDDLDPSELSRQVREIKHGGFGGFFMHSRNGLVTPFMSERWMECVATAVEEARKQGLQAWLYDEDRWPSGFAGGLVVRRNPDFGMKYLEPKPDGQGKYRFAVERQNGRLQAYRRLKDGEQPGVREDLESFSAEIAPPAPWFNDLPYADNMDPESVRAFLDICFEPYRRFSQQFGKTVPGIFTDEPDVYCVHNLPHGQRIPWTWRLPAEFKKRHGYDLLDRLPELYSGHPDFFKTRHDYWRTVTELFTEAYCKQLGEWCERNGLELTGHMLSEQDFEDLILVSGAAMPGLEYMQRPGIDILAEQVRETITCKQASSVAHQMGHPRTLSETYACSGWHLTFEGQKWSGDWQTVLGINTRCQSIVFYSLRGARKRDWPPAIDFHQPWWKYFPVIEEYYARACFFSAIGKPVREVLLLHNISTAWGDVPDYATRRRHGEHLLKVAEDLLALHYDFDLGDEIILSRHASVKGRRLSVGKAAYNVVVVPESISIFRSTAELLRQFLAAGGKVIAMRRRPTRIEGELSPELDALFAHKNVILISPARAELEDALRVALPRHVSITAGAGREVAPVIYQERSHQGRSYFLLANRDREAGYHLRLELPGEGAVEQWDLETGKIAPHAAHLAEGKTVTEVELPPTGSAALVLDPKKRPLARPAPRQNTIRRIALRRDWQVRRSMENSLLLDRSQWRFAGGEWSEEMPVWLAQKQLRTEMGLRDISTDYVPQPWVRFAEPSTVPPRSVELRFTFRVDRAPQSGVDLAVESAELFRLQVNGQPVESRAKGWWLDKSIDRVPLANLRQGENELILACDYRDAPEYELEDCYLVGEFGVVRQTDAITLEPKRIGIGDWCDQGYPYYAGNLFYGQELGLRLKPGQKAILEVGPHFGACLATHVNGKLAGVRGWPPYEFDLTRRLRAGRNWVELEVCGSPRNLLGPNHLPERRPEKTGPHNFFLLSQWVLPRNLLPYGLFGDVQLAIKSTER